MLVLTCALERLLTVEGLIALGALGRLAGARRREEMTVLLLLLALLLFLPLLSLLLLQDERRITSSVNSSDRRSMSECLIPICVQRSDAIAPHQQEVAHTRR